MQVRNGSSVVNGRLDRRGPEVAVRAAYPWTLTGSCPVDVLVAWALGDQRADGRRGLSRVEAESSGFAWQGSSTDGCVAIERIGMTGCRIDVSGAGRDVTHPAADAVAAAVERSPVAETLAHYGRQGVAPGGWAVPARWLVPEVWEVADVEAMWVYAQRRERAHCPLVAVASTDGIAAARAAYLEWWDGLAALAWALSTRALGFTVAEPRAEREPWAAEALDGEGLV